MDSLAKAVCGAGVSSDRFSSARIAFGHEQEEFSHVCGLPVAREREPVAFVKAIRDSAYGARGWVEAIYLARERRIWAEVLQIAGMRG